MFKRLTSTVCVVRSIALCPLGIFFSLCIRHCLHLARDRYVLRNSIGSKHIDKRQDYFFQNQDKMFNAHALLGNLFQDAGKNIQQFFDDVQKHFVMPIEAFVETDSKEVKLLKRRLDEREEKYMKHLRKFLDNKVRPSHKQKAESNESSNLKNKREYEIARFQ